MDENQRGETTGGMTSETAAQCGDSCDPPEGSLQACDNPSRPADSPLAHVVLYQPQIPQNTGNIGRTCVATAAKLWIVQPAAFQINEKRVRRAGLDYWQYLNWANVASWDELQHCLPERESEQRFWYFSRFAQQSIWESDFKAGDVFVFGSETTGLPRTIFNPSADNAIRLPTAPEVRSLNLSATVAVVLYETMRRHHVAAGCDDRGR